MLISTGYSGFTQIHFLFFRLLEFNNSIEHNFASCLFSSGVPIDNEICESFKLEPVIDLDVL
jgi:hypothetical protein